MAAFTRVLLTVPVCILVLAQGTGVTQARSQDHQVSADQARRNIQRALRAEGVRPFRAIYIEADVTKQVYERSGPFPPTLTFDTDLVIVRPDKFMLRERLPSGAGHIVTTLGFAGSDLLDNVRVVGSEAQAAMGTVPEVDLPERRRWASRWLALLSLAGMPGVPLSFSFRGIEKDGDRAVYAIGVQGGDDFSARVLVDRETWLPRLLRYQKPAPPFARVSPGATGAGAKGEQGAAVEAIWIPTAYKRVNGMTFPYRLTEEVQGRVAQDWTVRTIRVNAAVPASAVSR